MRIYKRGKVWWVSWTAGGETCRESTGCTDRTAAHLILVRKQRELADLHHHAKDQATLADAVDHFLATLVLTSAWIRRNSIVAS